MHIYLTYTQKGFFFFKAQIQYLQSMRIKREDSSSELNLYLLSKHSHRANAFKYN